VLGALILGIDTAAGVTGGKSATGVHHNPSATALASPSQPTPNYTSPTAPQPSGPPTGPIGDTLTITQDGQDAARVTITRVASSTQPADPTFMDGPQNGQFVTAHVKVEVLPSFTGGFDVGAVDLYAKVNGQHFDESNGNAMEAPGTSSELNYTTLTAGESAAGTLVFDLPSAHGKIAYAANLDGRPLGWWRFSGTSTGL